MAGLTETGFVAKRLNEVINDQRIRASDIYVDLLEEGDDFVDTSDVSTIGRFINLHAVEVERIWQQLGLLWAAEDPDSATGYALDVIGKLQGETRNSAVKSSGTVVVKGNTSITIPSDSKINSNVNNAEFLTTASVVLNPINAIEIDVQVLTVSNSTVYEIEYSITPTSTATVTYTSDSSATMNEIITGLATEITTNHPLLTLLSTTANSLSFRKTDIYNTSDFSATTNLSIIKVAKFVNVLSKDFGAISAEANSLVLIKTPVSGWDSVYNPVRVSEGSLRETDSDYRYRLKQTKSKRAANLIDALYSNLLNIQGVESVTIYENDTDTVDVNGLPRHSFMPVVLGGEAQTIADTIWLSHPAGIRSQGSSSATVVNAQGFPVVVRFQRPTPVNIYIEVELEKDVDVYPVNGDEAIIASIVNWAKTEYTVGKDVIASRIYTPVNEILGHKIVAIKISTSPSPTLSNDIAIGYIQIASVSSVNISVVGV